MSTIDLLALTSLESAAFGIENIIFLFQKQATLARRPMVLSVPLQLVFPGPILRQKQLFQTEFLIGC
jgi:hypothetical protein